MKLELLHLTSQRQYKRSRQVVEICALWVCFQFATYSALAVDALDRLITIDIPINTSLEDALIEWGSRAGVTVMINTPTVERKEAPSVRGRLTAREALNMLLGPSGLSYSEEGGRIRVFPSTAAVRSGLRLPLSDSEPLETNSEASGSKNANVDNATDLGGENGDQKAVPLVIVTAQKREERLQDVPAPITAISGESLTQSNQSGVEDFYATVPGLNLSNSGATGYATLAIRGLTTSGSGGGVTSPTVGITIDDVPISQGSNAFIPDIDASNLDHVEVLRGPQGTLYGSASLGGLIKYVTASPSLDTLSGRVAAHVESVHNGDGLGYRVEAAANLPITGTTAVRVSGFSRTVPGYIDDPTKNEEGVNRSSTRGGLGAFLWRPSDDFSIRLNALIQDISQQGNSTAMSGVNGLGELQQDFLRGSGMLDLRTNLYSAVVRGRLGGIDLTSVSAYSSFRVTRLNIDFSGFAPNFMVTEPEGDINQFTQEIRLSSSIGEKLDWLLGGFYSHQYYPIDQQIWIINPTSGAFTSQFGDIYFPSTLTESAGFGDITVHFTNRFDMQFGGRESYHSDTYNETDRGLYSSLVYGSPVNVLPTERSNDHAFTYLVVPQIKLSPDLMVYARFASGFRPGGPNSAATATYAIPRQFGPDKTTNYELGIKADVLDHRVSFDGSLYYINWENIQITVLDPVSEQSYVINASGAKSEGVEVSSKIRATRGLTIDGWVAWNEAVLTKAFPSTSPTVGMPGDRLPLASRWSGNLSLQQEGALVGGITGVARAVGIYVGDRLNDFSPSPQQPRAVMPGYFQLNLLAGVRFAGWEVNAYANNATDKRAAVNKAVSGRQPGQFNYIYIQPRTLGLSVAYTFPQHP